jgi:hydrogenase maturation protease
MSETRTIPIKLAAKHLASRKPPEVLVLGLGNTRLTDDGIGVRVVRHLARDPQTPPSLRALDAGAFGFRLLSTLNKAQAILLVDVAEIGAPAGTTCLFEREELALHISRGGQIAAYKSGLIELLNRTRINLTRLQGYKPKRLALLAVQPESLDWGDDLSAPVAAALPMVCEQVVCTVLAWQRAAEAVHSSQSGNGPSANQASAAL